MGINVRDEIIRCLGMRKAGQDDWRLPPGTECPHCGKTENANPGFSVSTKGWYCHHESEGGNLFALAGKLGRLPEGNENFSGAQAYERTKLEAEDKRAILEFMATRGFKVSDTQASVL